jgi:hypothetical protein
MAKKANIKAKEKRQRIIAAGGAVILLAVLAIQVPRTMKMLNPETPPPPPVAAPVSLPSSDPSVLPTPGTVGGGAGGTGSGSAAPASGTLVDSDPAPTALTGQLIAFGRFSSKDPFKQQIRPSARGGTPSEPAAGGKPSEPAAGGGSGSGSSGGFGGTTPGEPAGGSGGSGTAATAGSAVIAVNGAEESVAKGADFPKDAPVFTLVSLTGTTAKIAIAGGAFASGARTVTLKKGEPLTLVNTADGTRYELKLVSVG